MSKRERHKYWEENIAGFAGFYDKGSEENITAPFGLRWIYRRFLFPIEKHYMQQRYHMVERFIDDYIKPGMRVADIGCGSGVYTGIMAEKGAEVLAFDFAESALILAKENLAPECLPNVKFTRSDIMLTPIPEVDIAIAIGVLPYIEDASSFFSHVLPHTRHLLFNYINANNTLNRLRQQISILNVRNLAFHSQADLFSILTSHGFDIALTEKLATGCMVRAERVTR